MRKKRAGHYWNKLQLKENVLFTVQKRSTFTCFSVKIFRTCTLSFCRHFCDYFCPRVRIQIELSKQTSRGKGGQNCTPESSAFTAQTHHRGAILQGLTVRLERSVAKTAWSTVH